MSLSHLTTILVTALAMVNTAECVAPSMKTTKAAIDFQIRLLNYCDELYTQYWANKSAVFPTGSSCTTENCPAIYKGCFSSSQTVKDLVAKGNYCDIFKRELIRHCVRHKYVGNRRCYYSGGNHERRGHASVGEIACSTGAAANIWNQIPSMSHTCLQGLMVCIGQLEANIPERPWAQYPTGCEYFTMNIGSFSMTKCLTNVCSRPEVKVLTCDDTYKPEKAASNNSFPIFNNWLSICLCVCVSSLRLATQFNIEP